MVRIGRHTCLERCAKLQPSFADSSLTRNSLGQKARRSRHNWNLSQAKPQVVMPVDLFGQPRDYRTIAPVANTCFGARLAKNCKTSAAARALNPIALAERMVRLLIVVRFRGPGVAQTLFASLLQDYVAAHGWLCERRKGRMIAFIATPRWTNATSSRRYSKAGNRVLRTADGLSTITASP